MPKPDLGAKRICPACHTPFYDLRKNPAVCPNCGHGFDPSELIRGKRQQRPAVEAPKAAPPPPKPEAAEGEEAAEGDEEAGDEVLEDASDLGEDEEDMGEVIENVDEGQAEER